MISRREFLAAASCASVALSSGIAEAQSATYDRIIDVYDPNKLSMDEAVKNDIGAIIYQVGQGLCKVDKHYSDYRKAAKEKGILWGAYYMLSTEPNQSQLDRFLSIENGADEQVLMAVDWETACGGRMGYQQLHDFIQLFAGKLGYYPMIYGGSAIRECKQLIAGDKLFAKCPVWYLRYLDTPKGLPTKTWPTYDFWQYDDEKRQNGAPFPAKVLNGADWSRYRGDYEALKRAWPFRNKV